VTTDPKTLIERFPLTAEACKLDANVSSLTFSALVRDYARKNRIGDSAFDSVESLMSAIESHLAAKRPKPLTEEDVRAMLWGRSGRPITADGCVAGHGANLFMTTANAVTDACAYTTVLLCETKAPNCVIPRYYAAREAAEASLAERIAARSAAEAAKGGGE